VISSVSLRQLLNPQENYTLDEIAEMSGYSKAWWVEQQRQKRIAPVAYKKRPGKGGKPTPCFAGERLLACVIRNEEWRAKGGHNQHSSCLDPHRAMANAGKRTRNPNYNRPKKATTIHVAEMPESLRYWSSLAANRSNYGQKHRIGTKNGFISLLKSLGFSPESIRSARKET
jgi:hypothetical protein